MYSEKVERMQAKNGKDRKKEKQNKLIHYCGENRWNPREPFKTDTQHFFSLNQKQNYEQLIFPQNQ